MKKVLAILMFLFILTGCTKVNDLSYDDIVKTIGNKTLRENVYRTGYKYYLPRGMKVENATLFNEVITSNNGVYYLYIDAVSYYNKVQKEYKVKNVYYSKNINYQDKFGYVEINLLKNDKYLIEIMYNYAKIEVMVFQEDIKEIVTYVMSIISSITYNDNVIKNTLSSSRLDEFEESFNIFEIVGSDNYLQFSEEVVTDDRVKDPDYVN